MATLTLESISGDGVTSGGGAFATARANPASSVSTTGTTVIVYYCSYPTAATNYVYRPFFPFALTNPLLVGSKITGLVLKVMPYSATSTARAMNVYETTETDPTTLTVNDHANFNTTAFVDSDIAAADWTTDEYEEITLNSDAITLANSKIGSYLQLGVRFTADIAGTACETGSSGADKHIQFYMQNHATSTNRPNLVVTYSPPGGSFLFNLM